MALCSTGYFHTRRDYRFLINFFSKSSNRLSSKPMFSEGPSFLYVLMVIIGFWICAYQRRWPWHKQQRLRKSWTFTEIILYIADSRPNHGSAQFTYVSDNIPARSFAFSSLTGSFIPLTSPHVYIIAHLFKLRLFDWLLGSSRDARLRLRIISTYNIPAIKKKYITLIVFK